MIDRVAKATDDHRHESEDRRRNHAIRMPSQLAS